MRLANRTLVEGHTGQLYPGWKQIYTAGGRVVNTFWRPWLRIGRDYFPGNAL